VEDTKGLASHSEYDIAVIGAGPGGYVAAIRAVQLGLKTAIVECDEVGGICLNWGCIPSKALLRNAEVVTLFKHAEDFGVTYDNLHLDYSKAIDRSRNVVAKLTKGIAHLLRKNTVDHIVGEASFIDPHTLRISTSQDVIHAKNFIIATGARPKTIPPLPIDGDTIITSREALKQKDLPAQVIIVGGGAVGVEFASIYKAYGVDVTIVEMLPRILPNEDEEISQLLERYLGQQDIKIMTNAKVSGMTHSNGSVSIELEHNQTVSKLKCDKVLVAIGVQGNVEDLGLKEIGIAAEDGFIKIDDTMATNLPNVYAIGDVTGKLLLAHAASAQGVNAVESIAGLNPNPLIYKDMPKATYCHPQVSSFGLTEKEAKEQGRDIKIGKFPFQASGKALALGDTKGLIKLVTDAKYGEILGAHMIGPEVTELLATVSMTRMLEGTAGELGWLVHSHPTLSETLKEAALAAKDSAIHI